MAEEPHGFTQARARLEDIVSQVRKKDTSLEKSLDLLEEGVRLANQCTELIDHADWEAAAPSVAQAEDEPSDVAGEASETGDGSDAVASDASGSHDESGEVASGGATAESADDAETGSE